MSLRIVFGGIKHESNSFATFRTELKDFIVIRGRESISIFIEKCFPNICFIPT
ncbi:MAG TPA: hypothetical protein ENG40_04560, partial [Thermoprotei archaeon]|nr:hypothetical protein [Thermoprotei archaeon]